MEGVGWTTKWGAGIVAVAAAFLWLVSIWGAQQLSDANYPVVYWLGYWTVVQSCATWTFARAFPLVRGKTEYKVVMFRGPTLWLLVVAAVLFFAGPTLAALSLYWAAGLVVFLAAIGVWCAAVGLWYSENRKEQRRDAKGS